MYHTPKHVLTQPTTNAGPWGLKCRFIAKRQPCGPEGADSHTPRSCLTHLMQPDGAPVRPLLPRYVLVLIRVELVHQLHRVRHVLPAESGSSRISRGQGKGSVRQRWHWRRCGGGWSEALRPQQPPAVRAASRATRCWDGCAGAQQLGRALSTCSWSRLQAKGIGRLCHHKVQLVYGELAIAIEVESLEGRLGRQLERLRHRVELLRRARRQNIACCAHVKTDERQWSGARGRRI